MSRYTHHDPPTYIFILLLDCRHEAYHCEYVGVAPNWGAGDGRWCAVCQCNRTVLAVYDTARNPLR